MLPQINHNGAGRKQAQEAIALIERTGGPEPFINQAFSLEHIGPDINVIRSLKPALCIALEIAVNEEAGKGALRGDLAAMALEHDAARVVADTDYRLG